MPLFRVIPRMALRTSADAYTWSYVYYVEAADVNEAAAFGRDQLWPDLAVAHLNVAFCYEIYASDLNPATTLYTVLAVDPGDQPGAITPTTQLYNASIVVRVELNVAGGRPSRKYHRFPLTEDMITNGIALESVAIDALNTAYAGVVGETALRDESGNEFSGYTIKGITTRRLGKFARNSVPPSP